MSGADNVMPSLKILVADDNSPICALLTGVLESVGHKVTSAADGRQALLRLRAERFDLVIAEMLLPELDGIELILEMKKEFRSTPMIATSGGGYAGPIVYLKMAKALGAAAVLKKPFGNDELFAAIATASGAPASSSIAASTPRSGSN